MRGVEDFLMSSLASCELGIYQSVEKKSRGIAASSDFVSPLKCLNNLPHLQNLHVIEISSPQPLQAALQPIKLYPELHPLLKQQQHPLESAT